MRNPNPMKSAVQTFRALNPNHRFAARVVAPAKPTAAASTKEDDDGEVCGELFMYDAIGADWFGGITAKDVAAAVKEVEAAGAKKLNIYINSPGGDVFEGAAIYNCIARFKGEKHVYIDGLAASAASFIAMVGDKITTAFNAMWMVHNPWGIVIGNAAAMRETAATLDTIGGTLVETYVKRTKQSKEDIQTWLDAETWMTADVAKERGFTDDITDPDQDDDEEEDTDGDGDGAHARFTGAGASLLSKFTKTPAAMKPRSKDLIQSMEQRIMNLTRASPRGSAPGQPGKR